MQQNKMDIASQAIELLLILKKCTNDNSNSPKQLLEYYKAAAFDLSNLGYQNRGCERSRFWFFKGKNQLGELLENTRKQITALKANYELVIEEEQRLKPRR